jgi:dihydrofolate reductase
MGRLVYSMSVSLDGFVETPSRSLDWVLIDEQLHSFFNAEAHEMSAFVYGRRMYELMVDSWPTVEADPSATPAMLEFARIWRDKPKIVFSETLAGVAWNSRLVCDDAVGEVARVRAQPGFDMSVGGPTLAASLMQAGLIDEFRLFVHPVILGAGTPYFPALEDRIALRMLETRTFGSGVVYLRYAPFNSAVPI